VGLIYENVSAPLTVNHDQTSASPSKVGSATSQYFMVPIAYGAFSFAWDATNIQAAASNGGITKIAYADYNFYNILGIYQKFTITVHGD
jgi:hypothetical protein